MGKNVFVNQITILLMGCVAFVLLQLIIILFLASANVLSVNNGIKPSKNVSQNAPNSNSSITKNAYASLRPTKLMVSAVYALPSAPTLLVLKLVSATTVFPR